MNVARSIVAFPLLASFLSCPVAPVVHPSEGSPFLRLPHEGVPSPQAVEGAREAGWAGSR